MFYLAQCALQLPQEVIVAQVDGLVVDVVDPKFEFLHYFKVVVDDKLLGKLWRQAVLNFFCSCQLLKKVWAA